MSLASVQAESSLLSVTPGGVMAAGIIMPFAATTAVSLRLYARRWQRLSLGTDDWTALAASCLVGVLGIIIIIGSSLGALGLHSVLAESRKDRNPTQQISTDDTARRVVLAYSIVEKPAYILIKISILLLYRRIFKGTLFPRLIIACCGALAMAGLVFLIVSSLQCPSGNWDTWNTGMAPQHRCVSQEAVTVGFAITDVLTGVVILLMPLPITYNLNMTRSSKVGILLVFALGAVSLILGIIRMSIVCFLTYHGSPGYRDLLGTVSTITVLSIVEAGVAVVAACVPTLRNLIAYSCSRELKRSTFCFGNMKISDTENPQSPSSTTTTNVTAAARQRDTISRDGEACNAVVVIEDEIFSSPTKVKGPFGGAFPLQKISDAASGKGKLASSTEKSVSVVETEDHCSVLRHYDHVSQCWQ